MKTIRLMCGVAALPLSIGTALAQPTLTTERVAAGLASPLAFTHAGDPDRAFIVQQRGLIRVLDLTTDTVLPTPFLNLAGRVSQSGNERGLLGLAFHPDYANNGLFFVNYTDTASGDTVIARFSVGGDPDIADPNSFVQVLTFDQPFSNHNGGWIGFGPNDGYLYISAGDGGSGNDPGNRAQNTTLLLGKMLRIDIDGDDFPNDPDANYAIPASNPFAGGGGAGEVWAYGLRNPWRSSFDRATGDLWIADVGQNNYEEIDFEPAGSAGGNNYGWRCMEGFHCTGLTGCTCNDAGLVLPIHEYTHSQGCSVTGGSVYRGAAIPHLRGTYFFGDYCTAKLWSFRYDGSSKTEFADRTAELAPGGGVSINSVASFGEDANGEIYICDLGGEVFRAIPRCRVDLNGDGAADTLDVLAYLNYWSNADPAADFTGDGVVNTLDVLRFLNDWSEGCP